MQALLSTIFGAFLALLIWGFTFVPTASLTQSDDLDVSGEHTAQTVAESESDESKS